MDKSQPFSSTHGAIVMKKWLIFNAIFLCVIRSPLNKNNAGAGSCDVFEYKNASCLHPNTRDFFTQFFNTHSKHYHDHRWNGAGSACDKLPTLHERCHIQVARGGKLKKNRRLDSTIRRRLIDTLAIVSVLWGNMAKRKPDINGCYVLCICFTRRVG